MKLWFGVSKFASTSSLVNAVEWEKASDLVRTSHVTHTAHGPVSMAEYTMSCRPNFPTSITRRNVGLWLSNGLHDLFCQSRQCYTHAEGCVCKLCNSPADHKSHIIHCRWATKDEPFELNVSNINIILEWTTSLDSGSGSLIRRISLTHSLRVSVTSNVIITYHCSALLRNT